MTESGNFKIRQEFVKFMENMMFMQIRIKQKLDTRFSKIEVLINFWDKMVGHIH